MTTRHPLKLLMATPLPSIQTQHRGKFRPSKVEIAHIFNLLNTYIFGGKLAYPSIKIRGIEQEWGWCAISPSGKVKITIAKQLSCVQWFTLILAHEMVHQYQWEVDGPKRTAQNKEPLLNHGPSFFVFRDKLAKYGIPLRKAHCHEKWVKHQDLMKC